MFVGKPRTYTKTNGHLRKKILFFVKGKLKPLQWPKLVDPAEIYREKCVEKFKPFLTV